MGLSGLLSRIPPTPPRNLDKASRDASSLSEKDGSRSQTKGGFGMTESSNNFHAVNQLSLSQCYNYDDKLICKSRMFGYDRFGNMTEV